jgi:hypothetical protein
LQQAYDLKVAEKSLMKNILKTIMPYSPSSMVAS